MSSEANRTALSFVAAFAIVALVGASAVIGLPDPDNEAKQPAPVSAEQPGPEGDTPVTE